MKKFVFRNLFAAILGLVTISLSFNSCTKETDCRAVISVIDETLKEPVPSEVVMECTIEGCVVKDSMQTGLDGEAEFVFENPGILTVHVKHNGNRYSGEYVQLEAGETVEELVELPL